MFKKLSKIQREKLTEHELLLYNLRYNINDKGLKISWLAEKIGVSQPLLSLFLQNKRSLTKEKLKKLEKLLL